MVATQHQWSLDIVYHTSLKFGTSLNIPTSFKNVRTCDFVCKMYLNNKNFFHLMHVQRLARTILFTALPQLFARLFQSTPFEVHV